MPLGSTTSPFGASYHYTAYQLMGWITVICMAKLRTHMTNRGACTVWEVRFPCSFQWEVYNQYNWHKGLSCRHCDNNTPVHVAVIHRNG